LNCLHSTASPILIGVKLMMLRKQDQLIVNISDDLYNLYPR
jgi:hypothetical protein